MTNGDTNENKPKTRREAKKKAVGEEEMKSVKSLKQSRNLATEKCLWFRSTLKLWLIHQMDQTMREEGLVRWP